MTSKNEVKEQRLTLHNGTIVSNSQARSRIVASLRSFGISLAERQAVAAYLVDDPYNRGLLVSYLERIALSTWLDGPHIIGEESPTTWAFSGRKRT